jgi:hypothetical protein
MSDNRQNKGFRTLPVRPDTHRRARVLSDATGMKLWAITGLAIDAYAEKAFKQAAERATRDSR